MSGPDRQHSKEVENKTWGDYAVAGASNAHKAWCTVGHVTGAVATWVAGLPSTIPLDDTELLILLSKCAEDCYDFLLRDDLGEWVKITERAEDSVGCLLHGVYKITQGPHRGKTILAIQGTSATSNFVSIVQDIEILMKIVQEEADRERRPIPFIETGIERGIAMAKRLKPDFICGHSLGGFLTEIIASKLRIKGASFNCPGPYAFNQTKSLCGNSFDGLKFEIVLTRFDPVSQISMEKYGTPMNSHIGRPRFLEGSSHCNDATLREKLRSEICSESWSSKLSAVEVGTKIASQKRLQDKLRQKIREDPTRYWKIRNGVVIDAGTFTPKRSQK